MAENKRDPVLSQPEFNLWHLFRGDELQRKLPTFLAGGLWCAQLNSMVSFARSIEAEAPYGYFVSCWHKSRTDPTPRAWENFGASGDGIAIRVKFHSLNSLLANLDTGIIQGAVGEVRYLDSEEPVSNPAFEVRADHDKEEEVRIALTAEGTGLGHSDAIRESLKKNAPASIKAGTPIPRYDCVTFLDNDGDDDAVIIPIIPATFIEEVLIGNKLSSANSGVLTKALKDTPLAARVRPTVQT